MKIARMSTFRIKKKSEKKSLFVIYSMIYPPYNLVITLYCALSDKLKYELISGAPITYEIL